MQRAAPLAYTQFQCVCNYIRVRCTKECSYARYKNGEKIQRMVTPSLDERDTHGKDAVYSPDSL